MNLRALELQGFKSFADRTTLHFRDGLTAIVGSNGCGKSNIADALRWVLGEQRASALRSAKMDEVIFQGSLGRRPLNFAEVTLRFDNAGGRVGVPQSEIEVTRRAFREGGSEYSLNRNSCRLRDIHALLRDTGLGANAYSIMEASMIEVLLSDRAEERRLLFEEAAGVGRYKDSRQAAVRRLEAAEGDLTRLDDLLAEVDSKVRSLARQRRRAQRNRELLAERLNLEVALATAELERTGALLRETEDRHRHSTVEEQGAAAALAAAEARREECRLRSTTLAADRAAATERLQAVRQQLAEREREVLVAEERGTHAELRSKQLTMLRADLRQRHANAATAEARSRDEAERKEQSVNALQVRATAAAETADALRGRVAEARSCAEAGNARVHRTARETAAAQGERAAAERRRQEEAARGARLDRQRHQLGEQLAQFHEEENRLAGALEEQRARADRLAEAVQAARRQTDQLREQERRARTALHAARDQLARLDAECRAGESLERSYGGFAPAVSALMAQLPPLAGVHGPLADFVARLPGGPSAAAIELYLGPLLQAVVVDDLVAARRVRDWFRARGPAAGELLLLPLDAPALGPPASRPDGPRPGAAAWAEWLLRDVVDVRDRDPLQWAGSAPPRVSTTEAVDARGVVHLTNGPAEGGILARREALARLRAAREQAAKERDGLLHRMEQARAALAKAETDGEQRQAALRAAGAELHALQAQRGTHRQQHDRVVHDQAEIEQAHAEAVAAQAQAEQQCVEASARLEHLEREAAAAASDAAVLAQAAHVAEAEWHAWRDEDAELRIARARAEAESAASRRRRDALQEELRTLAEQERAAEAEARELGGALQALKTTVQRARAELDTLFALRDRHSAELAAADNAAREAETRAAELNAAAREQRRRESAAAEARHQAALQRAELSSQLDRVRERLQAEWGRPWPELTAAAELPLPQPPAEWPALLRQVREQLAALGPVNVLAEAEWEEEERRLLFLREQRADLVRARDDLGAAIRQINRTAREAFQTTFEEVRRNFHRTFQSLFQGGRCDLWLADPDDPLESAVEIQAAPGGKRTQRIHLLSGGERTLTALALLFALYLVKPSPFCLLDEVDAPLDESNVGRFLQLLHAFKAETQFIVITHNPRTMEAADWLYGVTMEEAGVSTLVGVEMVTAAEAERRDRVA